VVALALPATADSEPLHAARAGQSAPAAVPRGWHAPRAWLRDALCIHRREGAWNADTGNGYYGGFQFLLSTWVGAGGITRPNLASPREQLYRARLVWLRDGHSWREWGTAGACGLT
jgi:resuscitation-promoting factor RpfA